MNELQEDKVPEFEREERFTSIEPGQYWEAQKEYVTQDFYKYKVRQGLVLLVVDVDYVDGQPHTISMNYHPSWGKGSFKILALDFINTFVPSFNPEEVRNAEIAAIQARVAEKQQALNQAMTDPTLLQAEIQEKLVEWEASNKPESSSSTDLVVHGQMNMTPGSLISSQANSKDIDAMVYQAKRHAQVISLHSEVIQSKASEISDLVKSITPFMTEKADAMVARSKNAMKRVENIMKGVRSLSLYVGDGVEVNQVSDGESAPFEEKPHMMQAKLFANEELAVFMDVPDRFDFYSMKSLDEALKNPDFVTQVLPHPRSVVSMAIRRSDLDYGDPFRSAYNNAINQSAFLLIRDGEKIYRVHSSEPSHEHARRLFPTRREVDEIFKSWDKEITFESLQYTKALKEHEVNALHYKRLMILLCGLDHRMKLLGDFYPASEMMNFMTPQFQESHIRFVRDDDPDFVIQDGRIPVDQWILEKNKLVQSGSRVAFIPEDLIDAKTAPSCVKEKYDYRSYKNHIDVLARPTNKFEITTVSRQGDELVAFSEVKRESYRTDLARPIFNARIKIESSDHRFLCLDDVRSEELHYYIHNRSARIQGSLYINLFKRALKKIKEEEVLQADTEAYLLDAAKSASITDSMDVVRSAIRNWRCTKKGELLPSRGDLEALTPILDQIHSMTAGSESLVERVNRFVEESGLSPIQLSVTGKGHVVLYTETPEEEKTKVVEHKWVDRHTLRVGKNKIAITNTSKFWNANNQSVKEEVLHAWKDFEVIPYPAPCSFGDLDTYKKAVEEGYAFLVGEGHEKRLDIVESVIEKAKTLHYQSKSKYVICPVVSIPVALVLKEGKLTMVCVRTTYTDFIRQFGNEDQVNRAKDFFVGRFRIKENGVSKFYSDIHFSLSRENAFKDPINTHDNGSDFSASIGTVDLTKRTSYLDVATMETITEPEFEGADELEKTLCLLERRLKEVHKKQPAIQVYSPSCLDNIKNNQTRKASFYRGYNRRIK